jgi:hypothetical protein
VLLHSESVGSSKRSPHPSSYSPPPIPPLNPLSARLMVRCIDDAMENGKVVIRCEDVLTTSERMRRYRNANIVVISECFK